MKVWIHVTLRDAQFLRKRTRRGSSAVSVLLICALFSASAAGQQPPREPQQFLNKLGFSHDQIRQIEHGAVAVKILKSEKHEVAAVAVVRMHVPQDFFVARLRDIERHKKSEAVLQVRKFSDPARAEDFADLTLLPPDVRDLGTCRPGRCRFKLSASQMELIQKQVDFSAPNAQEQANAAMRRLLADYAREYDANGNRAMIVYADKDRSVNTATQFAALVDRSSDVLAYSPEFREYLLHFPEITLEGIERFLYWSKENYGHKLQSITAITDFVIYHRPGSNPPVLIASKQIYATHYLEASLALTMLFDRNETDPVPGFYLVYVNRSRIDLLRKWYSVFARASVSDNARSSIRKTVSELRSKVEAEFKAAQAQAGANRTFQNGRTYK